jgi:hypothetical protein
MSASQMQLNEIFFHDKTDKKSRYKYFAFLMRAKSKNFPQFSSTVFPALSASGKQKVINGYFARFSGYVEKLLFHF